MPVGHSTQHETTEKTTRNSTMTAQHGVLEYNAVKFGRTLTFRRNFLPSSSVEEIYLESGGGRCIRNAVTSKYMASRPGTASR